jgi:demethylmenaquinone methyltransferase/2-methoxy-6-polyprenyl-1,4-benzoquinol methylase
MLGVTPMSNENQTPTATQESAQNTDKVSPFLTEPLPQGTAQGQQKSLQQQLTDTPVTGSVPKYNLCLKLLNFGFGTI